MSWYITEMGLLNCSFLQCTATYSSLTHTNMDEPLKISDGDKVRPVFKKCRMQMCKATKSGWRRGIKKEERRSWLIKRGRSQREIEKEKSHRNGGENNIGNALFAGREIEIETCAAVENASASASTISSISTLFPTSCSTIKCEMEKHIKKAGKREGAEEQNICWLPVEMRHSGSQSVKSLKYEKY